MSTTRTARKCFATTRSRCCGAACPPERLKEREGPSKTLTDAHFLFCSALTGDVHPIHYDVEYAKTTRFEKPLDDIVATTDFFTTTENYKRTVAVRREFFKTSRPTSTGVLVAGLLRKDTLIEISAVAILRDT